jgi:hypothetical protein
MLTSKRTAAAGGSDAQVNTVAGIWAVVRDTLLAAGWTSHDVITLNSDQVLTSTGETGKEKVFFRLRISSSNNIRFEFYQYWDATGHVGYNKLGGYFFAGATGGSNGTGGEYYNYFDWVNLAANNHDYVVVADRDGFAAYFRNTTTSTAYLQNGGIMRRMRADRKDSVLSTTAMSAGTNVTVTTDVDLQGLGYQVYDKINVVAQQTTTIGTNTAQGTQQIIPCFTTYIEAFPTSNQVTLRTVPSAVSVGARLGYYPMPIYMLATYGTNRNPFTATTTEYNIRMLKTFSMSPDGTQGFPTGTTVAHNGFEGRFSVIHDDTVHDPNARTGRTGMSRPRIWYPLSQTAVMGYSHLLYYLHRTVSLFDTPRTYKTTPNKDYVAVSSTAFMALGPVA